MGKPQFITTESGEELVVLSRRDYAALRARAGDESAEDEMTAVLAGEARDRLASGEDMLLPSAVTKDILAGTKPLQAIRKWRGLTQQALADKAGLSQVMVSQIETGQRAGTTRVLKRLAEALGVPGAAFME